VTSSEPVIVPSTVTFGPKNVPPGCTGAEPGRVSLRGAERAGSFEKSDMNLLRKSGAKHSMRGGRGTCFNAPSRESYSEGMFYNVQRKLIAFLLLLAFLGCKGRGGKDMQYKTEKVDHGTVT